MKFRRSERRRAPARTRIAGSRTPPDSQSANLKPQRSDAIEFALKTAVAGFIRRHKLMEFEKSRLDELDIEIHLMKEGIVLSQDLKSSEKFVHGIKVLMAKNYIDNLSEEARKGMQEKAEQGIWPSKAPLGYRNVLAADGKKLSCPIPVRRTITHLFGWYATGTLSLKEMAEQAKRGGTYLPPHGRSPAG